MIECDSYSVVIFMAGDLSTAEQTCRRWCMETPCCVNVQPTKYIYTGGEETGVRVEFINYPRFPSEKSEIFEKAVLLADRLMVDLSQHSYSIATPEKTIWHSRRDRTA